MPAPRRTNAERRASTRSELLRLGLERFPAKGYSRTSLDDLLRDSGYSRGAFYFHFPSKERFFLEVFRHRVSDRGPWWQLAADPRLATLGDVLGALAGLAAQSGGQGGGEGGSGTATWALLLADFVHATRDDDALVAETRAARDAWIAEVARFVAILQERGLARADLPAGDLAELVQALHDGFDVQQAIRGRPTAHRTDAIARLLAP